MKCQYPDCHTEVKQRAGPGRPRIYCDSHRNKAASKRAVRFATLLARDPCCADAKRDNPRVRSCPQHQEWRKFMKDARRTYGGTERDRREFGRLLEAWGNVPGEPRGWRLSYNDTYIIESAKDRKLHKLADQFIATKGGTYGGRKNISLRLSLLWGLNANKV